MQTRVRRPPAGSLRPSGTATKMDATRKRLIASLLSRRLAPNGDLKMVKCEVCGELTIAAGAVRAICLKCSDAVRCADCGAVPVTFDDQDSLCLSCFDSRKSKRDSTV